MRRALHLLSAVLFIGCSPAAPEESAPAAAQAARLRAPDVHYEPTPQRIVHRMLALARVGPSDVVYDLGSGDGRIPIIAVRDYGARGVGIDIDPERIAEAEVNASDEGVTDRVRFRNEDLLLADFREATVVTLFLSRELNRQVKPRLLAELKPGTRIVSYYHDMPAWRPRQILRAGDDYIYLWIIPER